MNLHHDQDISAQLRAIREQHRKDFVGSCILVGAISFGLLGAFLLLVEFFMPAV